MKSRWDISEIGALIAGSSAWLMFGFAIAILAHDDWPAYFLYIPWLGIGLMGLGSFREH